MRYLTISQRYNRPAGRLQLGGICFMLLVLTACQNETSSAPTMQMPVAAAPATVVRGQDPEQIAQGKALFHQYCSVCHGENAAGTPDWREPGSDGRFPPPPLDGTAHAWHHPTAQLHNTIKNGGPVGQSNMPGFGQQLDDQKIDAVIAYIKSLWSDEIYAAWYEREQQALAYLNKQKP